MIIVCMAFCTFFEADLVPEVAVVIWQAAVGDAALAATAIAFSRNALSSATKATSCRWINSVADYFEGLDWFFQVLAALVGNFFLTLFFELISHFNLRYNNIGRLVDNGSTSSSEAGCITGNGINLFIVT